MNFIKSIFRRFFEDEINEIQKNLKAAKDSIRVKDSKIRNLEVNLKRSKDSLEISKNRINELKTLVTTQQDRINQESAKNERLNNMLGSIHDRYSERIHGMERKHQNELDALTTQLNKVREESALKEYQFTENITVLKQSLENNATQYDICEGKLKDAQISIQQLEIKLQTSIEESRQNSEFLAEIIKEKEFLECKLESKENDIQSKEDDILRYRADIEKLQVQLKEAENNSEVVRAMQADIRAKQDTIARLENDIQALNEEIAKARDAKDNLSSELEKLKNEHRELQDKFNHLSTISSSALEKEQKLNKALNDIENLTRQLDQSPTVQDLQDKENIISELNTQIQKLKEEINSLKKTPEEDKQPEPQIPQQPDPTPGEPQGQFTGQHPTPRGEGLPGRQHPKRIKYRPLKSPYGKKPDPVPEILAEEDFPPVENDNRYFVSQRLIDHVYDVRKNVMRDAEEIFQIPVEELTNLNRELLLAVDNNTPYLVCPCCNQMVIIASRRCGWGKSFREVQYFTHAVKNVPCDLKREPSYSHLEGDFVDNIEDINIQNFRRLLYNALNRSVSHEKGIKEIEEKATIFSNELPFMNRRVADVTATYGDHQLVFEIVRKSTGVRKVLDRDRFYLINRRQVFWIFGLDAVVNYNELKSNVAYDILFTNKRNVFVFDKEAQDASIARGELVLKCNWLDADGEWHYQIEKNGKNGELIILDQIHYDPESCRPYKTDADTSYFEAHPYAERPIPVSREKLRKELKELYEFEQERLKAYQDMESQGTRVTAFFDGEKWGFKYKDLILIGPTFTDEPQYIGGWAKVNKDGRFGVVNRFGEYVLNPDYKNLEILPNGAIVYAYENAWKVFGILDAISYFNTNDELETEIISEENNIYKLLIRKNLYRNQLPVKFYFVGDDIFAKDNTTGKWSLLYSKGAKITNITYDTMEFTDDAKIKVTIDGRTQILSLEGVILEEEKKYKSLFPLVDGYQLAQTFENTYHLINPEDEKISDEYLQLEKLSDEYLRYYRDGRWGVIRYDGKVITGPEYEAITDFDGNLFTAQLSNPSSPDKPFDGKIDVDGRRIENSISHIEEYEIIESFGQYGAKRNKLQIIPIVYSSLEFWGIDKFIAGKNGKYGIVDDRGIIVLPLEHDGITPLQAGKSNISRSGKIWFINDKLQIVEDEVINLQEGYKKIKKEGKWGVVNPQGETIVDFLYDEITTFRGRLIGIINRRLVKLSAYYPYRLRMRGKNVASKEKDLVDVAGIQFQISPRRKNVVANKSADIVLINWTSSMTLPQVQTYNPQKASKKSRHIDKPEDFLTGETFIASITSFKKGTGKGKGKIKLANVTIDENRISHISLNDFIKSKIDSNTLKIGMKLNITKLGYDEEYDRTIWTVKLIP